MLYAGAAAAGALRVRTSSSPGERSTRGLPPMSQWPCAGRSGTRSARSWVGRSGLRGRLYVERHGRWLHLDIEKLDRAERWFERWEDLAVFLGRLTPVVRSFVSIPAGVMELPFVRYTLLTLAGSAIWCFFFAGAGYAVGENWRTFITPSGTSSTWSPRRSERSRSGSSCDTSGGGDGDWPRSRRREWLTPAKLAPVTQQIP